MHYFSWGIHHYDSSGRKSKYATETLQWIKSSGCSAGLALKPETPASIVSPLLPYVDLIMVMTVNPGYSGQSFMPEMIEKIGQVKSLVDQNANVKYIQVDGGINQETIQAGGNGRGKLHCCRYCNF